jgi:SAM-dependent methyltransferase
MDGMLDLVLRAKDAAVLDIGCNRGLVGFEMANNGAKLVHGVDNYEDGITTARHLFADLRNCISRFEVVDLTAGPLALRPMEPQVYDITLMLATYHKLKRIMDQKALSDLMQYLARRTKKYFGWRGTSDKPSENEGEIFALDRDFKMVGMKRIHTSYLSETLGVACIWGRV